MKIDADMDAIDKAIRDALWCGTGVLKFSFTDGMVACDHVPIKQYVQFADELKWRSERSAHEEKNT